MKLPKIKLTGINLLNLAGAAIILYLVVTLAGTVQRNYALSQQLEALDAQTQLLQEQKDQLAYSIQYYNTDAFRDREARSKLGLQAPGENVVIIPRPTPTPTPQASTEANKPAKSNLQQWFDFVAGRK